MDAVDRAKYDCLLFDLDDTLYPLSSGINLACRRNIEEYMVQQQNIEESEVSRMCLELYREYGTTMAGLKALGYDFDNDEFHEYVHGRLPYETLKPDPVLRSLLLSMPQRKIIFTNSDKAHVTRVLSRLGLEDCFEGVICFETLNPSSQQSDGIIEGDEAIDPSYLKPQTVCKSSVLSDDIIEGEETIDPSNLKPRILCKPNVEAIEAAIRIANIDPKRTIFFDDSTRNIASGKAAGLHTVIVGSSVLAPGADYALSSIHNIKEALPDIWESEGGEQVEQVLQPPAVETVVLA